MHMYMEYSNSVITDNVILVRHKLTIFNCPSNDVSVTCERSAALSAVSRSRRADHRSRFADGSDWLVTETQPSTTGSSIPARIAPISGLIQSQTCSLVLYDPALGTVMHLLFPVTLIIMIYWRKHHNLFKGINYHTCLLCM